MSNKNDLKFLIVDDSKISRKRLSNLLKEMGYEIIYEAVDGLDAISQFKKHNVDYILMDLEMPKMNGDIASKEIINLNPDVHIILVTSIIDKKELVGALRAGVEKILQKPITLEKLQQAIKEIEDRA